MASYYNEIDPHAAAWLRELMKAGCITKGDVDERSICDVRPDDLRGYTQCHFFAGIGGWDYALRLAGWGDRPVWTGSCPCQPFSQAGEGKGEQDERHLWPYLRGLIAECGPATVFGEQVASGAGRRWLSGVRTDLEELGHEVGAADLCSVGVGAPHIRQRIYWVGDSNRSGSQGRIIGRIGTNKRTIGASSVVVWVGDSNVIGRDGRQQRRGRGKPGERATAAIGGADREQAQERSAVGFWGEREWLSCADQKKRAIEPGTFPLAHGVPARVGRLRGYGNAITPQVAATFIRAYRGCEADRYAQENA